jgi:hypothetical protein
MPHLKILPMFHPHLHLHAVLTRGTERSILGTFQTEKFFSDIGEHWIENHLLFSTPESLKFSTEDTGHVEYGRDDWLLVFDTSNFVHAYRRFGRTYSFQFIVKLFTFNYFNPKDGGRKIKV